MAISSIAFMVWPVERPGGVLAWTSAAGIELVAKHAVGAGDALDVDHGAQRHHRPAVGAGLQLLDLRVVLRKGVSAWANTS